MHAIPLRLRGQAIGVLSLFRRMPGADLALGQALADVATIGILQERAIRRGDVLNKQSQTALHNRVVIEQAKGVVAQHLGWRWTPRSIGCAATPVATTSDWLTWPAASSAVNWTSTC